MKEISKIVNRFEESIFTTMTNLAMEYNAINLSQGMPDFESAGHISDLAYKSMKSGKNSLN